MLHTSHHRFPGRGPMNVTAESALWTAGVMIVTLLAIAILFFGVLANRAL